jgi:hypothetical protein
MPTVYAQLQRLPNSSRFTPYPQRAIIPPMARVLCINPWIVDFVAFNQWIEPLGLLTVAGVLRAAGHEVTLLDCLDRHHPSSPAPRSPRDSYGCGHFTKVELSRPPLLAHVPRHWGRYGLPLEVVQAELAAQPRPDAVLVTSMMTYGYPGPFAAIRLVKEHWPGIPVALGGVYATLCAHHARQHSGADAVLCGPGEQQALDWVNGVTDESRVPNLGLSAILPAHDLRRPQGYVAIQTARGCPFHCPYCGVHQISPGGFAPRPTAQVVEEIVWCVESLGAADVAFYDDALLVNAARHIHPILDGIIRRGLRVRFHTPNGLHARFIDRPLAEKMRQAGFVTIRLGLETVDPRETLRDGGKVDEASFAQAVKALFAAGFTPRDVAAYVLVGRPPRPELADARQLDAAYATVAFAQRLGVQVRVAEFAPVPATTEWQAAVDAGCIPWDADPLLHNKALYPCGDAQALEELKRQVRHANRVLLGETESWQEG